MNPKKLEHWLKRQKLQAEFAKQRAGQRLLGRGGLQPIYEIEFGKTAEEFSSQAALLSFVRSRNITVDKITVILSDERSRQEYIIATWPARR